MTALCKRLGKLKAEFRPSEGGRLASLRYGGVDLVLPPGRVPGYYGDTFWPPPPVLDAEPYEVLTDSACELTMLSAPDPGFGLQLKKRFTLFQASMQVEFTLTNTWPQPQSVAPWQVTRAPREGLLVWASGEPFEDADRVRKQREDPGCWFLHSAIDGTFEGLATVGPHASIAVSEVGHTSKFFTDARGWLAHVHHGTLFLRMFPDLTIAQIAPRQGEVELFFGLERNYIELENQGAYQTLAPGASLDYAVQWRFAAVDPDLPVDRITPELVLAIDSLLEGRAPVLTRAPGI
jgi:hypothetical protein